MNALDFYKDVVELNCEELRQKPNDYRAAVNAITASDALVGIRASDIDINDMILRDELAQKSECYRLLKDMAFAIKHGKLTHPKPRLVREASAAVSAKGIWSNAGVWDDTDIWCDEAIYIYVEGGEKRVAAYKLVSEVREFLFDQFTTNSGRPPKTLDRLRGILG